MDIPIEPASIRSGDTTLWNKSLADYPASAGWTLTYTLILQSDASKRLAVNATVSGADYVVTLTALNTAGLTPGTYHLFGHVTKASERYQVHVSTVEVLPNLAAVLTGDLRSDIKKKLDAVEAVILGKATNDQQSLSINGRSLTRYTMAEMVLLRDRLKADYAAELAKEQIGRTGINPNRIGLRVQRV